MNKDKNVVENLHRILEKLSKFGEEGINEKILLKDYTKDQLEAVAKLSAYNINRTIILENRNGETIWSIHPRGYNLLWESEQGRLNLKQVKIQEKQQEIIERQTEFTRALTIATIVLAMGAFLQICIQLINIPPGTYKNIITQIGFSGGVIMFSFIIIFLGFMGFLLYKTLRPKTNK